VHDGKPWIERLASDALINHRLFNYSAPCIAVEYA
jgi:hypothetical protein